MELDTKQQDRLVDQVAKALKGEKLYARNIELGGLLRESPQEFERQYGQYLSDDERKLLASQETSAQSVVPNAQAPAPGITLSRDELERHVAEVLDIAAAALDSPAAPQKQSIAAAAGRRPIDAQRAFFGLLRSAAKSTAFDSLRSLLVDAGKAELPQPARRAPEQKQFELTVDFAQAVATARLAVPGRERLWGRAFVTAILFGPEPIDSEITREWQEGWLPHLRDRWSGFLEEDDKQYSEGWQHALASLGELSKRHEEAPSTSAWLARYAADTGAGQDKLGIERDVEAMASVIAAEGMEPPLSVGLFGNWGSGKTFFMEKLDEAIQKRAALARSESHAHDLYVENVASIWFNAWHFMDANLWPSIVSRIFEGIVESVRGPETERDKARARILEQVQLTRHELRNAETEHTAKETARKEAETELTRLSKAREAAEKEVERTDYWKAVNASTAANALLEIAPKVRVDGETVSAQHAYQQVSQALGEMQTLWSRIDKLRQGWFPELNFRRELRVWAIIAVVLGVCAAGGVYWFEPDLSGVVGILTAVTTAAGWLITKLVKAGKQAGEISSRLEAFERSAHEEESSERRRVDAAATRLAQLRSEEQHALDRKHELKRQEQEVSARLEELKAGRLLEHFVQERIQSHDYRKNLGVISIIREDFENLEQLLRGARAERAQQGAEAGGAADGLQLDRIVLFIDDLDRCPRKRVIEVLQAVHLLLAQRLFVVVVAVDPRWLQDALEHAQQFELHVDQDGSSEDDRATPLNYLEKIFQVPYTLRPMQSSSYSDYVRHLTRPPGSEPAAAGSRTHTETVGESDRPKDGQATGSVHGSETGSDMAGEASPSAKAKGAGASGSAPTVDSDEHAEDVSSSPSTSAGSEPVISDEERRTLLSAEPVSLTDLERDFLEKLGPPVIRTPRAAKRLVNCYRFLRATLLRSDLPAFTNEERPVCVGALTLLALATGRPNLAGIAFQRLGALVEGSDHVEQKASDFMADVFAQTNESAGMTSWLDGVSPALDALSAADLKSSLGLVRKYTFVIAPGRVEP